MRAILLFFVALLAAGCANRPNDYSAKTPAIVIAPYFDEPVSGKATQTAFESGDQIGVFAVYEGQGLAARGNLIDNACFEVSSDGSIRARPIDLYYPDNGTMVDMMAYYPYRSDVADVTRFKHAVKLNQSADVDMAQSDLCFARQATLPTADARRMQFKHILSRVSFDFTLPSKIGARTVAAIDQISMINSVVDITLNMSADSPVILGSTRGSVSTSGRDLIVPAQMFLKNVPLFSITVRYTNSETEDFVYAAEQDVVLAQSTTSRFSLSLSDNGTVALSNSVVVEPWIESINAGGLSDRAKNSFTAHWSLPHKDYAGIDRVVLTIKDAVSGTVSDFATTFTRIQAGATSEMCTILFSFEPSASANLSYPYSIEQVKFYDGSTLVQDCLTINAAKVYKRGDYTLGIEQDHILMVSTGAIKSWDELIQGGGVVGGVTSSFRLKLIEPSYDPSLIDEVRMKIGSVTYVFDGLSVESGSNVFLTTTTAFSFPDKNGLSPTSYPYTISRVDLYDANGLLLNGAATSVDVTRSGLMTLQFYRNEIILLLPTTDPWDDLTQTGSVATGSSFRLKLIEPSYNASQISEVRIKIGSVVYLFDGMTTEPGSNSLLSTTTVFSFPDKNGLSPTAYPYSISRVDLYDSNGMLLNGATTSIEVARSGLVTLQFYRNEIVALLSTVGSWGESASSGGVDYSGVLASNPVTLYYMDGRATLLRPCTSAVKMVLTIGGVPFTYTIAMTGTGSSAKSGKVEISSGLPKASLPSVYPYLVQGVKLYDGSGSLLIESVLSTPLVVHHAGALTLRVVR